MNQQPLHYSEHLYRQTLKDTAALEKYASDYPYSSLAGFLLLYHYKKTDQQAFEKNVKKVALHFSNTHWLQFLLNEPVITDKTEFKEYDFKNNNERETKEVIHSKEIQEIFISQPLNKEAENTNIADTNKPETLVAEELPVIPSVDNEKQEVKENHLAENTDEQNEEITFEPLHTVDYFASQGIKINEEPVTNDKLGNQMKSFTAWLKSMKRVHPVNSDALHTIAEKSIQNAAEESNVDTEVLTEAMAEVLIKQDKKDKAIEMFSKLSLINPAKSAYFAAKIESIKSS